MITPSLCQFLALVPSAAIFACRAPAPLPPAPADTGGFVVMLGNDTISAESFTRTGDRIEGVVMRRSPRTVVVRYVLSLTPSGAPARLEYNTRLADGSMVPGGPRGVVVTFTGDSAFTEVMRDTIARRRVVLHSGYPEIDGAVSLSGLPVGMLKAMNRDSAMFLSYPANSMEGSRTPVASRGGNRYWLYSFDSPIEITTDDAGRVLSVDGSRTTVRIQGRRLGAVDVPALAMMFAERERRTGPLGFFSPRDSTIATVGGARISVDYSRPAARGRTIWGPMGVLGDTLWRTGANASTKFTTPVALSIGGRSLAPGTYTLTTLAIPGRYHLIFSTLQGVEVTRVPLQSAPIDPHVERFTIGIDPAGDRSGILRLRWDRLELSTPFSVQ